MAENTERSSDEDKALRQRLRDFTILTSGAVSVLALLFFTNAIGLVEWVTGGIVMVAGSLAYFVGSLPPTVRRVDAEAAQPQRATNPEEIMTPLLAALPFPTLFLDAATRITFANALAKDVFRLTNAEGSLAGAAIRQPDLIAAFGRVAETGAGERVEFSLGGEAETWMAYIEAGPLPQSVIVVLEDQSAVRQAERARADFLANASHELRTPLTAIGGFIETMRGPARDDKDAWDGFLTIIQEQTERMKRLVSDLLSLSRIEFSEHRAPSSRADMLAIVNETHQALQPIADDADVTLTLQAPETEIPIIADHDELTQVIQNLASNAIKYAPTGSDIKLTLGTAPTMREAAELCSRQVSGATRATLLAPRASSSVPAVWLRVEDTGPGIPAQHLPRLGERFYRADESRGGKISGTGLGLAIVKHIMARHRGGLAVESMDQQGAAFGVWMPVVHVANAA
ncbi:MAG: ATP-binding protein [Pseudomonadota bacterium]